MTFRGAHGFTLQHCLSCEVSSAKCALEISKNKQLRRNCSAGKKNNYVATRIVTKIDSHILIHSKAIRLDTPFQQ